MKNLLKYIRFLIGKYFVEKGSLYSASAMLLWGCPVGTVGYSKFELYKEMSEIYYSIGEAFLNV